MAPYPLRTTLLAFADDMAVVTATARQHTHVDTNTKQGETILHDVTHYLKSNNLLVHNEKSTTMTTRNVRPPSLRPGDPPMRLVSTATYLGVQQATKPENVTLPPKLVQQLAKAVVIACITSLSTQALAYFLQAVLRELIVAHISAFHSSQLVFSLFPTVSPL